MACWLDEPEVNNPHRRRDPKPPGGVPEALRHVTTARSIVHFKLCVGLDGLVARVVVLRSSGSREVDAHYASVLSTWVFPPLKREDTAMRSVVPVAVVLDR